MKDEDPLSLYIMLLIGAAVGAKAIWWSFCLVLSWMGLVPFDFLVALVPAEWSFTRFDFLTGPFAYCAAGGIEAITDECIAGGAWTLGSSILSVVIAASVIDKAMSEGYTSIAVLGGLLILLAGAPMAWAFIMSVIVIIITIIALLSKAARAAGFQGFDIR